MAEAIITVIVRNGIVQNVENIPSGTKIRVLDFDVEGLKARDTQHAGKQAVVSEFSAQPLPVPSPAAQITRNTSVLNQIIEALGDLLISSPHALARLERHFETSLIVVAGDVQTVAAHAEKLRLAVITSECGVVLDFIAQRKNARISIDHVEDAINTLFEDRFIEP